MRWSVALIAVACLAAGLLPPGHARQDASRIVDRTFSCEAGFVGGLHQVTFNSGYATSPGSSALRASSSVAMNIYEGLGSLSSDGFTIHRRHCVATKGTVELTTKRMRGGAVPSLGARVTCETPRRLLMRVRAVFKAPVTLQTTRRFGFPLLSAMGELDQAAFAIGTKTGVTIAYLSVTGTERARLFTRRTCKED